MALPPTTMNWTFPKVVYFDLKNSNIYKININYIYYIKYILYNILLYIYIYINIIYKYKQKLYIYIIYIYIYIYIYNI